MRCNIVKFLKVLSHPDRLRLTIELVRGEKSVGQLAEIQGVSTSTVSQHLARLRDAGVVTGSRRAQKIYYRVANRCPAHELVQRLAEFFTTVRRAGLPRVSI